MILSRLLEKFLEDSNKHNTGYIESIKKRAAAAESFIVMVAKMESKLLLMELNFKQVLFKLWNDKILNFLMGKYYLIFSFEKTKHTFIINIYLCSHEEKMSLIFLSSFTFNDRNCYWNEKKNPFACPFSRVFQSLSLSNRIDWNFKFLWDFISFIFLLTCSS